ncbi:hypothetical protein J7L67_09570 [bacterium]|nr:hypothetical protein [bacterium]
MDDTQKYFYELLSAKLDNELSVEQEKELREYIGSHPECKSVYADFKQVKDYTSQFYSSMKNDVADTFLWDKVHERIKTDQSQSKIIFLIKRHKWVSLGSSVIAAGIMIFFSFYLFLFSPKKYSIKDNKCIVNSIESGKSSVMVFKDKKTNTTIIWMFSAYKDTNSIKRTTL